MTSTPRLVRLAALGAPTLLFLYGVLLLIAGHGRGLAWNLGHTLFFVAFLLLGVLTLGLRQLVAATRVWKRIVANVAAVAGLVGVACFLWGILGDLFPGIHDAAPVPQPLQVICPLLFQLGILTLLIMVVTAQPRRLLWGSPLLVLVGFLLFAVNLDLIPIGALLLLAGLTPLAGRRLAGARPK
jgi:hypothetical protein